MTKVIEKRRTSATISNAMLLACIFLLSACNSTPKQFSINGAGDNILNRDIQGKSLSVVVRIYQLKDASDFAKLTFDTVAAGVPDSELLGTSLLAKTDVILVPGGTYSNAEKLLDETRYVGIVGLFRNPDPHHWRQLVEVKEIDRSRHGLKFRAYDCYIVLEDIKPLLLPGQPPAARRDCGIGNFAPATPARPPQGRTPYGERQPASPTPAQGTQPAAGKSYPNMPEVNVSVPNSITPTNVRFGGPGGTTITVGEPAPTYAPAPANPSGPGYYSPPGSYAPTR